MPPLTLTSLKPGAFIYLTPGKSSLGLSLLLGGVLISDWRSLERLMNRSLLSCVHRRCEPSHRRCVWRQCGKTPAARERKQCRREMFNQTHHFHLPPLGFSPWLTIRMVRKNPRALAGLGLESPPPFIDHSKNCPRFSSLVRHR